MGVVWAATHAVTRKAVALKILKPDKARDPVILQRFVREARAASAVRHPNIIEIRDVIEFADGIPAMVMDLLDGESLGARIDREGPMPLAVLAPIMVQVLSAVGTAHAAGVVHRDLKPDNIFLVAEDGGVSVRVLDFGIAKVLPTSGAADVAHGLTGTGVILGTPYYMAPEQLFGERDIDARADVWSLGVILYECLAGRRPTEAENVGQILRLIMTGAIVPLRAAAPHLPADVTALVDGMLQADRPLRPSSLVDAHETLGRYAQGVAAAPPNPSPRPPTGAARTVVQGSASNVSPHAITLASTTASTTSDRFPHVGPRTHPALLLGGIGAATLAAIGALLLLEARGSAPRAAAGSAAIVATPPASVAPSGVATAATPPSASAPPAAVVLEPPTAASSAAHPAGPPAHPPAARDTPPRFDPYEHM
jgi:serine/threonine-protein kinase